MFVLICNFCEKEFNSICIKTNYCKECVKIFENNKVPKNSRKYFVKGYKYCLKEIIRKSI